MSKLDPGLRLLVAQRTPSVPAAVPAADRRYPDYVQLSVKFTGAIADLQALGFEAPTVLTHPTRDFTIAAGSIALARVDALADIPHVASIEGSRPLYSELNRSIPEIGAGPTKFPASQFKGRNVVIGVIDTGFDYRHGVFRKPDGTTRILAIWDHTLTADPARGEKPPDGFTSGTEYLPGKIDEALKAADKDFDDALKIVRTTDRLEHGTGIAGIAAGDGSQAGTADGRGNCEPPFTFVGAAPEAELILVKIFAPDFTPIGESQPIEQAFDYIFGHPSVAGRPVVVNFSQGDHFGAHDGTTHLEESLEVLLSQSRRVVVKSAGNDGANDHHAEGTVPAAPGTLTIGLKVVPEDSAQRFVEIWYPGSASLGIEVLPPGRAVSGNRIVQPGEPPFALNVASTHPTVLTITSDTNRPENGDKRIRVQIEPSVAAEDPEIISGPWKLRLSNNGAASVSFHAWSIGDDKKVPVFTSHVTERCTITIPGTSPAVITVGAYTHFGDNRGRIADFSSRGPTRKGVNDKPDLVAPGRNIVSARANKEGSGCSDCCVNFYDAEKKGSGTSVAAPHVAGAVALMFEKNPNQTAAEIMERLKKGVRKPDGQTLPNAVFGSGLLDVSAALAFVPDPGGADLRRDGPVRSAASARRPARPADRTMGRPNRRERQGPTPLSMLPAFATLRGQALTTPAGQMYAALISRYFSETRGLIRSNRRVGAVWQRVGGPLLIGQLLQRVFEPDRPLPRTLNDAALSTAVDRFLRVLHRYGSPDLCRDIDRHGGMVAALEGRSLNRILGRGR
jgi:subtilisin family serine protease